MRPRTAVTALAALLPLAAACTTSEDPTPKATPNRAADNEPAPTTSEPDQPRKLDTAWRWTHNDPELGPAAGTTTALDYKQPITGVYPPEQDGEEWGRLTVKVCVTKGNVRVSQFPWSLAYESGKRVEVTGLNGGDFPRPEFPMDAAVKPGDCTRGGIMFPVPKGERPDRAVYAPDSGDGEAEWAVPKR